MLSLLYCSCLFVFVYVSTFIAITINKLELYCEERWACWLNTIYPPMKQFSSNPTDELFILYGQLNTGSSNHIFSIDGTKYSTIICSKCTYYPGQWTLYWGPYMNESSDLLNSSHSYHPSTNDISSIYSTYIGYNNDDRYNNI